MQKRGTRQSSRAGTRNSRSSKKTTAGNSKPSPESGPTIKGDTKNTTKNTKKKRSKNNVSDTAAIDTADASSEIPTDTEDRISVPKDNDSMHDGGRRGPRRAATAVTKKYAESDPDDEVSDSGTQATGCLSSSDDEVVESPSPPPPARASRKAAKNIEKPSKGMQKKGRKQLNAPKTDEEKENKENEGGEQETGSSKRKTRSSGRTQKKRTVEEGPETARASSPTHKKSKMNKTSSAAPQDRSEENEADEDSQSIQEDDELYIHTSATKSGAPTGRSENRGRQRAHERRAKRAVRRSPKRGTNAPSTSTPSSVGNKSQASSDRDRRRHIWEELEPEDWRVVTAIDY